MLQSGMRRVMHAMIHGRSYSPESRRPTTLASMSRTTLLLLLALSWFSFGHTTRQSDDEVSKIYLVGTTLYRATGGKMIDIYDLSVPVAPRKVGGIAVTENSDIAVAGRYLYADQGADLVVIDVGDPSRPVPVDTIKGIFNQAYSYGWGRDDGNPGVIEGGGMQGCGPCAASEATTAPAADSRSGGRGGSLSRFAIVDHRLYCVDYSTIRVFDISDPSRPRYKNGVSIGWGIETVVADGLYLFIGGETGMSIYQRRGDDVAYVSEFRHRRSCDPVVVEGNRAYVTLRGGTTCGGFTNQLDIIDISNISGPVLINSHPLNGPFGLAVRDGIVVVCDGSAGLKVLDVANPLNVREVASITDIVPHDVILSGTLLIVTTDQGYLLYDASDLRNLVRVGLVG